jgi:hypothetical protein
MFLSAGCSPFKADGLSCSWDVLSGGLGISKLQSLIKKIYIKFYAVNFLLLFLVLKTLDLEPDLH